MSWKQAENGKWQFIRHVDEPYEEALKRCMSDAAYTAADEDWLCLLVFATEIIAAKLNPSGNPVPFGTSYQVKYPEISELSLPDS
ncbi:TPA: hypothetical protein JM841_001203 [Shigella sonnei]|uniref:hypothetical protein n=1 Tax=Escherichia coli TaxID=562 RepID=UPI00005F2D3F|nr:hypothetical protein [Escherichia coli]EDU66674.1 hypothetical protein Ec53638_1176 [Escherichia coli 53638]ELH9734883.1 hypothetical protein [Shigella flexneri]HAY9622841.1 hypothetical protein [Shigella sonnei]HAY9750596.1 hypothetical protein [Shigella sonnei]